MTTYSSTSSAANIDPGDGSAAPDSTLQEEVRFSVVLYGGVSLAIYISGVCIELLSLVRSTSDVLQKGVEPSSDGGRPLDDSVATARVYRALASLAGPELAVSDEKSAHFWHYLAEGPTGLSGSYGEDRPEEPSSEQRQVIVERLLALGHKRKITVDVLSGSSAGGLNALYLAKALINDQDMSRIKRLWVDQGGLDSLIDDENVGGGSNEVGGESFVVRPTHFPSSTLSGHWFYKSLYDALRLMNSDDPDRKPLVDALDAYLTTTDLRGIRRRIALDADKEVDELLHRVVGHLVFGRSYSTGGDRNDFDFDHFLAFIGRATAAHPAAFHPAQLREISGLVNGSASEAAHDACGSVCGVDDAAFCPRDPRWGTLLKPNHPEEGVYQRWYSDGGDMDNKPFGYALEPVGLRRALRPVDRKLLYVEPSPGRLGGGWEQSDRPTLARYVMDAWSLGRAEPISDDIAQIEARNTRIAGIRQNLTDQVESLQLTEPSIWAESDPSISTKKLLERRDERGRLWIEAAESQPSSYERRRYQQVTSGLVQLVDRLSSLADDPLTSKQIQATTARHIQRRYPLGAEAVAPNAVNYRTLLVDFDIGYRLRRLGLIDQLLSDAQRLLRQGVERAGSQSSISSTLIAKVPTTVADYEQLLTAIVACRTALNECFLKIRTYGRALRGSTRDEEPSILDDQAEAIADRMDAIRMSPVMVNQELWRTAAATQGQTDASSVPADIDLQPILDDIGDCGRDLLLEISVASRRAIAALPDPFGSRVRACWDNYDRLDGLILTSWNDTQGEIDPVEVMRISPLDAQSIVSSDTGRKKIAGDAVSHFGGFFDSRWRSLDLLWGRLDSAEILIRNLIPIELDLPDGERRCRHLVRNSLITEAQLAIIVDETEAVESLHLLATEDARPEAPLSSERPEEVLTYLRNTFDVEHSLTTDAERLRVKNELVQRLPRVIGRVIASQKVDRSSPPLTAKVRSLSLGRSAGAVAQLARPVTVVAHVARALIYLIAIAAMVGVLAPFGLLVADLFRGDGRAGLVCGAGIGCLGLGTAVVRLYGDRILNLLSGIALLAGAVFLPVWALGRSGFADRNHAAGMAALFFLASLAGGILLAVGGTVDRAGRAAWIGMLTFLGGVTVLGFGLARSWPLVLLVIASASTAIIFCAVVMLLRKLGSAIAGIGEG